LMLIAGGKVNSFTSYENAASLLRNGLRLIGDLQAEFWNYPRENREMYSSGNLDGLDPYELILNLHLNLFECELLFQREQEADKYYKIIMENAKVSDRMELMLRKVRMLFMLDNWQNAMELGQSLFCNLGISLTIDTSNVIQSEQDTIFLEMVSKMNKLLESNELDPNKLSLLKDDRINLIGKLFEIMIQNAYFFRRELLSYLSCRAMEFTLTHIKEGLGETDSVILAYFGTVCAHKQELLIAYKFGQLGKLLADRFPNKWTCRAYFVNTVFLNPISGSLKSNYTQLLKTFQMAFSSGDINSVLLAANFLMSTPLWSGDPLDNVLQICKEYLMPFRLPMHPQKTEWIILLKGVQMIVRTLRARLPSQHMDDHMLEMFPHIEGVSDLLALHYEHHPKGSIASGWFLIMRAFMFHVLERYEETCNLADRWRTVERFNTGFQVIELRFYHSLALLALYSKVNDPQKQAQMLEDVTQYHADVKAWAKCCPQNYLHMHVLIKAELCRVRNQLDLASKFYQKAVFLADRNGYLHQEATANELAAKFFIQQGMPWTALGFAGKAIQLFRAWGCPKKVYLLTRYFNSVMLPLDLLEMSPRQSQLNFQSHSNSFIPVKELQQLFLSLSCETSNLKGTLLPLIVENVLRFSEADQCHVILNQFASDLVRRNSSASATISDFDDSNVLPDLVVAAFGRVASRSGSNPLFQFDILPFPSPLESYHSSLPISLIHYVAVAQTSVMLDMHSLGQWETDPYLSTKLEGSVYCFPLVHKRFIVGILYLERSSRILASSAAVTEIIAVQIAICLQNAMILENLERKNQELELKDRMQSELMDSNKLLHALLPEGAIMKLKKGDNFIANSFEEISILYTDLVDFTKMSAEVTALQLMQFLNELYSAFDSIIQKYRLYKVETIGDAYSIIGGAFSSKKNQYARIGLLALDLLRILQDYRAPNGKIMQMRLGIDVGSVYGGVIGLKMPRYCFFGRTASLALKMENTSRPDYCQVSEACYERMHNLGLFEFSEKHQVLLVDEVINTYFLIGLRKSACIDSFLSESDSVGIEDISGENAFQFPED